MKRRDVFGWKALFAWWALLAIMAAGCSGFDESDDDEAPAPSYRYALVACADWAGRNSLAAIQLKPEAYPVRWLDYLVDLGDDPWLDPIVRTNDRSGQHRAFVLQREYFSAAGFGTIALLDPGERFQVAARYPVNDGVNWSNPHDILALSATKAYVTRWDPAYNDLVILNPETGAISGAIDFTGLGTTADGVPRLHKLYYFQDRVWVLMQNINALFSEYGQGAIAVVNPQTDAIEDIIVLDLANPSDLAYDAESERIYVAAAGDWTAPATSGVEAVNPASRTTVGVILGGEALGGFVTDLAIVNAGQAYLVVTKPGWGTGDKVVRVNLAQGTIGDTVYEYPGLYVPELALDLNQNLLILDNSASRVVLLNLASGLITGTLETVAPPVSIAIWEGPDKL